MIHQRSSRAPHHPRDGSCLYYKRVLTLALRPSRTFYISTSPTRPPCPPRKRVLHACAASARALRPARRPPAATPLRSAGPASVGGRPSARSQSCRTNEAGVKSAPASALGGRPHRDDHARGLRRAINCNWQSLAVVSDWSCHCCQIALIFSTRLLCSRVSGLKALGVYNP